MPWYNLYSTELKFSLSLQKSNYLNVIPLVLAAIMALISCMVLNFNGLHVSFKLSIIISAVVGTCCYFSLRMCAVVQVPTNAFLLSNNGVLSFAANQHYQLLNESFIYPYGCSLSLQKIAEPNLTKQSTLSNHNKEHCMIFKDSLSNVDYRRLCRIIIKQKVV